VLHVVRPGRKHDEHPLGAKQAVETDFKGVQTSGDVTMKVVEHSYPIQAALEESANGYDLVLVGTGAEWGLQQRQFGLNPEHLIQQCRTSVLVIRKHQAG